VLQRMRDIRQEEPEQE